MNPRLTFIEIKNSADIVALLKRTSQGSKLEASFKDVAGDDLNIALFTNMATLLVGGRTRYCIVQFPVQDPDYFAEYHTYYSRQFTKSSQFCSRLHFFSGPESNSSTIGPDAIVAIDEFYSFRDQYEYQGFITLRPVRHSPIGASILKPPQGMYVTCHDAFEVHIAGRSFTIDGTPFMQQDNAVGACAQTAVWMALRTTRRRDGLAAYTPSQVSQAATQALMLSRILPNREGLGVPHIVDSVRNLGYSSHVIDLRSPISSVSQQSNVNPLRLTPEAMDRARQKIHRYIESGIPIILIVESSKRSGAHALVIVGHGPLRAPHRQPQGEEAEPIKRIRINGMADQALSTIPVYPASRWMSYFVVHNEGKGAYQRLSENTAEAKEEYFLQYATHAIPLLPKDVFMSAEEASETGLDLLEKLLPTDKSLGRPEPVVKRLYLIDRYEFRTWAANCSSLPPTVKRHYRGHILPRRMWVMEFSLADSYHEADKGKARRIGEIVIDASADHFEAPVLLAYFDLTVFGRADGVLYVRNVDPKSGDEQIKALPISAGAQEGSAECWCQPTLRGYFHGEEGTGH